MYAITLNGQRRFPLYTSEEAAKNVLEFLNTHGDGQGYKGYVMSKV